MDQYDIQDKTIYLVSLTCVLIAGMYLSANLLVDYRYYLSGIAYLHTLISGMYCWE